MRRGDDVFHRRRRDRGRGGLGCISQPPSSRDVTRLLDDDDDDDEETVESPTTMRRAARDVVERARREYRSRRALEKTHASASSIDRSLEETRRALDAARVLDDDEDDELVEIDALLRACRR